MAGIQRSAIDGRDGIQKRGSCEEMWSEIRERPCIFQERAKCRVLLCEQPLFFALPCLTAAVSSSGCVASRDMVGGEYGSIGEVIDVRVQMGVEAVSCPAALFKRSALHFRRKSCYYRI